eukprot:jgi/Chlat1/3228/Chrsp22S03507
MVAPVALGAGGGWEEWAGKLVAGGPTAFLTPSGELGAAARSAAAALFAQAAASLTSAPQRALHADPVLDPEQVWVQIDSLTGPLLSAARRRLRRVEARSDDIKLISEDQEPSLRGDANGEQANQSAEETGDEAPSASDPDQRNETEVMRNFNAKSKVKTVATKTAKGVKRPVEDEFLSLDDMERFVADAEDREYNQDEDEEDEEGEEGDEEGDEDEDDEDGGDEEPSGRSNEKESNGKLSTHEIRAQRLAQKVAALEDANLSPAAWLMAGEVTGSKRPQNSVLSAQLDFEHVQRPAPVITEEVTQTLEDIIKKRIADAQFDDVQRKAPPSTAPVKDRVEVDEKKSSKGLAEIYEEDYMRVAAGVDAVTSVSEADAIKKELDALSHYHYAPKPVIEDMAVRADVPALALEEVAPVGVSDANLLAPEEIFQGKKES